MDIEKELRSMKESKFKAFLQRLRDKGKVQAERDLLTLAASIGTHREDRDNFNSFSSKFGKEKK